MSEFGKGFSYCLGLFLAHAEKDCGQDINYDGHVWLWFHGAADHLLEFDAENAPHSLRERCILFKEKCLRWRMALFGEKPIVDDKEWAIQEAKDILLEYDRLNDFNVEKGEYE